MERDDKDYSEYSVTKTYSIKIKNARKVDEVASLEGINKSQALNKIIEDYGKSTN